MYHWNNFRKCFGTLVVFNVYCVDGCPHMKVIIYFLPDTSSVSQYEGALKSSWPNNEKKLIYNFKIIFIFQHNVP